MHAYRMYSSVNKDIMAASDRSTGSVTDSVTSAMIQEALSQIPPTIGENVRTNTSFGQSTTLTESPRGRDRNFYDEGSGKSSLVNSEQIVEDSLNEEPELEYAYGNSKRENKFGSMDSDERLLDYPKGHGTFPSNSNSNTTLDKVERDSNEIDSVISENKEISKGIEQRLSEGKNNSIGINVSGKGFIDRLYNTNVSKKRDLSEAKTPQRGAGVRRKKRARATGGGAKAVRVPPDKDFVPGLAAPLTTLLRKGGRGLNPLQMQKLIDATTALQQMQVHILEPLTLYTAAELYDLMASMTETWKNSGKAAWKKRINKIRENARGRKPPRNKLDEAELEEIKHLERRIQEREEWERQEKDKLRKLQAKAAQAEFNSRKGKRSRPHSKRKKGATTP